jgi:hypothetical protein
MGRDGGRRRHIRKGVKAQVPKENRTDPLHRRRGGGGRRPSTGPRASGVRESDGTPVKVRLTPVRNGSVGESPTPAGRDPPTRTPPSRETVRSPTGRRRRQHPVGLRAKPGGPATGGESPPKAVTGRVGRGQRLPSGAVPTFVVGPIHPEFTPRAVPRPPSEGDPSTVVSPVVTLN